MCYDHPKVTIDFISEYRADPGEMILRGPKEEVLDCVEKIKSLLVDIEHDLRFNQLGIDSDNSHISCSSKSIIFSVFLLNLILIN
jgi:hypothetical protein